MVSGNQNRGWGHEEENQVITNSFASNWGVGDTTDAFRSDYERGR
jgi:hypothetical protein